MAAIALKVKWQKDGATALTRFVLCQHAQEKTLDGGMAYKVALNLRFRHYAGLKPSTDPRFLIMTFELYIGGAMALALGVYLVYALTHPEKF